MSLISIDLRDAEGSAVKASLGVYYTNETQVIFC